MRRPSVRHADEIDAQPKRSRVCRSLPGSWHRDTPNARHRVEALIECRDRRRTVVKQHSRVKRVTRADPLDRREQLSRSVRVGEGHGPYRGAELRTDRRQSLPGLADAERSTGARFRAGPRCSSQRRSHPRGPARRTGGPDLVVAAFDEHRDVRINEDHHPRPASFSASICSMSPVGVPS